MKAVSCMRQSIQHHPKYSYHISYLHFILSELYLLSPISFLLCVILFIFRLGFSGEAATAAQMIKKKILEKLAPQVTHILINY